MSNEFKPRKATFTEKTEKSQRVFVPVNKRAKTVARKLGKRTRLTVADMKKAKKMGSYKLYKYTESGLRAVRV